MQYIKLSQTNKKLHITKDFYNNFLFIYIIFKIIENL